MIWPYSRRLIVNARHCNPPNILNQWKVQENARILAWGVGGGIMTSGGDELLGKGYIAPTETHILILQRRQHDMTSFRMPNPCYLSLQLPNILYQ